MKNLTDRFNDSITKNEIDDSIILELARIEINKMNLSDSIKNIYISSQHNLLPPKVSGQYSYFDKTIIIDTNKLNTKNILVTYKLILQSLYHEIQHANQLNLLLKYNRNSLIDLLSSSNFTIEKLKEFDKAVTFTYSGTIMLNEYLYHKKYYLFPEEHEADFWGTYKMFKVMQQIYPNLNNTFYEEIRNHYLFKYLIANYKINPFTKKVISPLEQLKPHKTDKELRKYALTSTNLDNFEKLTLGLPISKDLYLSIYHDSKLEPCPNFDKYVKQLKS